MVGQVRSPTVTQRPLLDLCRLRVSCTLCFSLISPLAAPLTTQIPPLECRRQSRWSSPGSRRPVFVAPLRKTNGGILSQLFSKNHLFSLPYPSPRPSAPHRPGVSVLHRPVVSRSRVHSLSSPVAPEVSRSFPPPVRRRPQKKGSSSILEFISPEVFTQRPVCCNIISDATVKCSI